MNKFLKVSAALDWIFGLIFLVAAAYFQNGWYLASAVVAFTAAWFKPAVRLKNYLEKHFIKKRKPNTTEQALKADEFYEKAVQSAVQAPVVSVANNYKASGPTVRPGLSANKHNVLKGHHLNLYEDKPARHWA